MLWSRLQEQKFDQHVQHHLAEYTHFTFIKFLGSGSYGRAYLIEDTFSQNRFVLKCLRPKHRFNKKVKFKFMQEINMLEQLDMPFIPTIKMKSFIQGSPSFVMDYADGKTFEQLIFQEGKIFTLSQSLKITEELLTIVMSLHTVGIVHRDLRIPNILLVNEQLYLIDFGLATYMKEVELQNISNPKRTENHISDLYFVGHFLLFLLYSSYVPTTRKEKSWQEELSLPFEITQYIERLLCITKPFQNSAEALQLLPK